MKKQPIRFEDYQIKPTRKGTKMKIQLKDNTVLIKSFDISAINFDTDAAINIHLGELESMNLWQKVTVNVSVWY